MRSLFLLSTVVFLTMLSPSAFASQVCVVWDPSDSYANVRQSPNGRVLERRENGSLVEVVGISYDTKRRPWVDIVSRGSSGQFILKALVRNCMEGSFAPDGRIIIH